MAFDNEQLVRKAYQIAEDKDMAGWSAAFTVDGTFTDMSINVTWTGPDELPEQVVNYARAFPDMHRELYQVYVSGNMVVVQLALQGTHLRAAAPARRDPAAHRQADGRPLLRRLRAYRRQDQALRLLPGRHDHPHPARRVRQPGRRADALTGAPLGAWPGPDGDGGPVVHSTVNVVANGLPPTLPVFTDLLADDKRLSAKTLNSRRRYGVCDAG